jgi:hypothetical protein
VSANSININQSPEALIILAFTHYARKIFKLVKKAAGITGIIFLFAGYLVFLPLLIIIIKTSNWRLKKLIDKIHISINAENYQVYLDGYYQIQQLMDKMTWGKDIEYHKKRFSAWYVRPIMKELLYSYTLIDNFNNSLEEQLFFDLKELGFSDEEITQAKLKLQPFKDGWEDGESWASFEEKYNKYTFQE